MPATIRAYGKALTSADPEIIPGAVPIMVQAIDAGDKCDTAAFQPRPFVISGSTHLHHLRSGLYRSPELSNEGIFCATACD